MQPMYRRLIVGALIAGIVAACTGSSGSPGVGLAIAPANRISADPAEALLAANAINDFGLDLLRAAIRGDENAVLSPASVALALGMARPGAGGRTATQIDAVLREVASDAHQGWLNALDAALAARSGTFRDHAGKDSTVTLRIANAPFAQKDYAWNPDYLAALGSRFGAGVRLVDYRTDSEAARQAINGWVKERTEDRIPELLDRTAIDGMVRLVLVNAIYLKAAWLTPFVEASTTDGSFTRLDGSTATARFMHEAESLRYAAGESWRAVELPYVGGELAMTIIVPDDLKDFVADLGADRFTTIVGALEDHQVDLALPRFGTETKVDLATVLAAMGMPDAFDMARADFSRMTTAERLFISAVIHQANIDVDEKGTTAAAATAVGIRATGAPVEPIKMSVDRPFVFALRDLTTGAILFLGQITQPAA
jgi:serpin B